MNDAFLGTPEDGKVPDEIDDTLAPLYEKAKSCTSGPDDCSALAYTELCLVIARLCQQRNTDSTQLSASKIRERLSEEALESMRGSGGPTGVMSSDDTVRVHAKPKRYKDDNGDVRWRNTASRWEAGILALGAINAVPNNIDLRSLAVATQELVELGVLEKLESLFSCGTDTGQIKTSENEDVWDPKKASTATRSKEQTKQPTQEPEENSRPDDNDTPEAEQAQAIVSVSTSVVSGGEIRVESISASDKRRFEGSGLTIKIATGCELGATGCDLSGGEPDNRFRLRVLPDLEIKSLLRRSPRGDYPRNAVPADLYELSVEWRPVLAEAEPLAALFQYNLMSFWREDDYNFEDDCTNIPLPYDKIFCAFGLTEDMAYQRGLNSGMLLELYRAMVDPLLDWTNWHPKKGKVRVLKRHGIPRSIVEQRKSMLGPGSIENRRELITGKVASRRDWSAPINKARQKEIDEHDPIITPPDATKRIQAYLNGLDLQYFAHGGHGNLRGEMIDQAIWEAASSTLEEQRRDQERMKLHWMRIFPQPLYDFCDRFPRLKADHYNQAMNLPSRILRAMYTENDYELDLSKAHLGSYVPVAKREGLEVPILEDYLSANLSGEIDLWAELASMLGSAMSDAKARRKAVKRAYSAVYGADPQRLLFFIVKKYAHITGTWLSTSTVEPLLTHPLVEELLETRDKLEAIITSRGGLEDATGRFIPLDAWSETKDEGNRWRGVMAYVNASYEQKLMVAAFDEAREEKRSDGRTDFKIWLYQADGFTVRMRSRVSHSKRIDRLQSAVAQKANELGVPTELEVDYPPSE